MRRGMGSRVIDPSYTCKARQTYENDKAVAAATEPVMAFGWTGRTRRIYPSQRFCPTADFHLFPLDFLEISNFMDEAVLFLLLIHRRMRIS